MKLDFYSKNEIKKLPIVGCGVARLEYDYEEKKVFLVCKDFNTQREHRFTFCGVLFFSMKSRETISSEKEIFRIDVLEDCIPLKQLREFQLQKQADGKAYASPFLSDDMELLSIHLEMPEKVYLVICTEIEYNTLVSGKRSDIDTLFDCLDRDETPEIQQKGIEMARSVERLSVFLRPQESRRTWKNCAVILSQRTDEELSGYVDELFEWVRDSACPGASIIRGRLSRMAPQFLISAFSRSVIAAREAGDTFRIYSLKTFAEEREELFKMLSKRVQKLLINWNIKK